MARFAVGAVFGLVVGVIAGAAAGLHASSEADDTVAAAAEAGVDPQDLRGAVNTTGLQPHDYLVAVGHLAPLVPPIAAALRARVACIEAKESGGANVWNRRGSGAGGVLQYMPGTFARGAREMGHPEWSLWNPEQARAVAAHDLALGRRAQWTVAGC
jgi:hypothetical protein